MRKIAVVGTGLMGTIYARLLHEHAGASLVAVSGNSAEKTKTLAARFGAEGFSGGDVNALLKRHPDLDGVVVATPEWVRSTVLQPLIEARLPVLLEKPLCTSPEELKVLDDLTRGRSENISVVHSLRFSPRFARTKELVSKGSIGEIRHIYARRNPSLRSVKRVLGKFDLAYWLLCHDVDLIRWMTGSEVERVLGITRNQLKSEDDYLIAHLKMKSGVDAICEISWCSPPVSDVASQCSFNLKGTQGILEVMDSEMNVRLYGEDARVTSPDTYESYRAGDGTYGVFHSVIDNWVRHLGGKGGAVVSYGEARQAVRICAMVSKSVLESRVVSAEEI